MDRLGAGTLRGVEDALGREVALGRRRRPEQERLVRVRDVKCGAIAFGVDADCADVELAERAKDADRDLPPVGDENLLEHEGRILHACN